jgi:hypothetical protein
MAIMLKESDVLEQGIQALKECFQLIPSVEIVPFERDAWEGEADFLMYVRTRSANQLIFVEVKSPGTPKNVRNVVNSLSSVLRRNPAGYGMVVAPYVSPKSAEICASAGMGYLDLSGNCRIAFQEVFINRQNFPNKYPYKAGLSSLYSPKAERILRVLLTYPYRPWKTLTLADEAQVSPGMITHVRRKLDEEEWIESNPEGFQLIQPATLLQDWAENYSFRKSITLDCYSIKNLAEVEKEIAEACDALSIRYALTSFSASNRLAPMVRHPRVTAYIDQSTNRLAEKLSMKPVESGANVALVRPYDAGVFWNAQEVEGIKIATPIQVYLDLVNNRGRGEEAATFLYREVIEATWQQQRMNTTRS